MRNLDGARQVSCRRTVHHLLPITPSRPAKLSTVRKSVRLLQLSQGVRCAQSQEIEPGAQAQRSFACAADAHNDHTKQNTLSKAHMAHHSFAICPTQMAKFESKALASQCIPAFDSNTLRTPTVLCVSCTLATRLMLPGISPGFTTAHRTEMRRSHQTHCNTKPALDLKLKGHVAVQLAYCTAPNHQYFVGNRNSIHK